MADRLSASLYVRLVEPADSGPEAGLRGSERGAMRGTLATQALLTHRVELK